MAPELHLGADAGVASDVYSVGCLLWAVLTGHAPYGGTTEYEVIRGHVEHPVRQLVPHDPLVAEVNRVLARSMAKRPEHRHPDATTLRRDLEALAERARGAWPPLVPLGPGGAGVGGPSHPSHPGQPSHPSHPSGPRASDPRPPYAPPAPSGGGMSPSTVIGLVVLGSALVGLLVVLAVVAGLS